MKLAEFSVKQSLFVNLLSVFLILAGLFALFRLQREAFPNVSFDMIRVTTVYSGASSEEVEKLITTPIEKELKRVDGIDEIMSSSNENFSTVFLKIDPDVKNKDRVVTDTQRAVDRVKDLPEDADDPEVLEIASKEIPIIEVSLSGELPEKRLQKYAEALEDRLVDIPGVASVEKSGFRDREMWVEVDPSKLKEYHVSIEEIMQALEKRNISVPGGKVSTEDVEFAIRTTGEFETAEEIMEVVIRANDVGNWLKVKDVAHVRDTFEDEDIISKTFGTRAINLVVTKKLSGDAITIVNKIKKIGEEFKQGAPGVFKISYVYDLSFYIKRRLNVLRRNGYIGVVLVLTSLLVFLNRRVAMMTALGIPIAFFTTFAVMGYFGMSINLITMFGLIIVLGMLVDDGIIIAENAYRYMEGGMLPREAAVRGAQEVMKPVTATILTTIAAFSPLLFMTGIIGKFVRGIPIVVIIALMASLFEAFIILPSHLADFVRMKKDKTGKVVSKKEAPWFQKLLGGYTKVLTAAINRRRRVAIGLVLLFVICILVVFTIMKFVLFPARGIEFFFIRAEAPVGTPLEKTNKLLKPIEDMMMQLPENELDAFVTLVGRIEEERVISPYARQASHVAQITVYLTPERERKRTVQEIIESFREKKDQFKGFEEIVFAMPEAGPPVGRPVAIRIRGEKFETLEEIANKYVEYMKTIDGALDVKHDYLVGKNEIRVIINEDAATKAYLTVGEIAATVRNAFEGGIATSIKRAKAEEEIDVLVRFPEEERKKISTFEDLLIPNKFENLVPLNKVARVEKGKGMFSIRHLDGKRVVTVSANTDVRKITPLKLNRIVAKHFRDIESQYVGYTVRYGGEQEETIESMKSLFRAFALAFFLMFMILASNFKSLVQPIVVMLAIPFGMVGVIVAFLIHNEPLSFMSLMGIIGLSGVVVNDSIVLMDFINKLRREGHDRKQSIIRAGQLRLRPVILTTVTTVLGLLPVAYGIGGGDPFLKPMALAISWGLAFATALTLIVIPCIYSIVDDVTIFLIHRATVVKERKAQKGW